MAKTSAALLKFEPPVVQLTGLYFSSTATSFPDFILRAAGEKKKKIKNYTTAKIPGCFIWYPAITQTSLCGYFSTSKEAKTSLARYKINILILRTATSLARVHLLLDMVIKHEASPGLKECIMAQRKTTASKPIRGAQPRVALQTRWTCFSAPKQLSAHF